MPMSPEDQALFERELNEIFRFCERSGDWDEIKIRSAAERMFLYHIGCGRLRSLLVEDFDRMYRLSQIRLDVDVRTNMTPSWAGPYGRTYYICVRCSHFKAEFYRGIEFGYRVADPDYGYGVIEKKPKAYSPGACKTCKKEIPGHIAECSECFAEKAVWSHLKKMAVAVSNAVAIKWAANLSLRPYAIVRCINQTRCVCAKHGLTVGVIVPADLRFRIHTTNGQACRSCFEEAEKVYMGIETLVFLCRLGAALLWENLDDTTKRFMLVREEREFDPEHPCRWVADPNRDFVKRLSLIELSDKPEPVKIPPKPLPAVSYIPDVRERPSKIDKWNGVGDLLLELD